MTQSVLACRTFLTSARLQESSISSTRAQHGLPSPARMKARAASDGARGEGSGVGGSDAVRGLSTPLPRPLPTTCARKRALWGEGSRGGERVAYISLRRALAISTAGIAVLTVVGQEPTVAETLRPYAVVGDAIPASLTGQKGNPQRGRAIVGNRQVGLCLLCHRGPFPEEKFQGTVAPDLAGAGTRWSEGQLRLRIVDSRRINPDSIMPPYYRIDGLTRVAANFARKPILTAEQIEDVVSYLITLRDEESKDR